MASFRIDKTNIKFAGGRTGSEVISITNAPSGGISITNSGFGTYFRVVTQTQNQSYRIETKSTNTSGNTRGAYIRFVNNDDSNDYVDVVVQQYSVSTISLYVGNKTMSDAANQTYSTDFGGGRFLIYLDYLNSDVENLVVNFTEDWLSYDGVLYQDTGGFKLIAIDFSENTGTSNRIGTVNFTNGSNTVTFSILQYGQDNSYLTISPTSSIENGEIVSRISIELSTNISNITYNISDTSWIEYLDYNSSQNIYRFTVYPNSGSSSRTGTITFSGGGLSQDYIVTQLASGQGYLNIYPEPRSGSLQQENTSIGYPGGTFDVIVDTNLAPVTYSIIDNHIQFVSKIGNVYTFRCGSNTSAINVGNYDIVFYAGGLSETFTILQYNTSDSYINITPEYDIVGSSAGTVSITTSGTAQNINVYANQNWINTIGSSNPYTISYDANTTSSKRYGRIGFRCETADGTFRRIYTLVQEGQDTSYLTINPSSSYVDYMSGSTRVAVSSDDLLSVSVSTSYDWISCYPEGSSREYYTVAYSTNTSSSQRSGVVNFMLPGVTTAAYALYQGGQGGGPSPVIGITPSSDTVTSAAGSVSVNLRTQNVDTVRCSVLDSWIHKISESIGGTYVFSYSTNTSSSSRTGTVRFTATGPGGTTSRDYTLTQAGTIPRIKSVIDNLRFYSEGGTITVNLINKPSNLNSSITYIDGTGWLTVTDQTVVCSVNTGIARNAVIRFYDTDDNTNYVDIPVIQGGSTYYESVWVNNVFIPLETGNYHYSIQISNPNLNRYFEGLTPIPQEGININRLVDDYIYSELLSQTQSEDWASMSMGYCTAELYNITETQTLETTHYLWNDWSGKEKRYDYTRSLNDPINHKGCNGMIIPFCVYKDTNDNKSFSIIQEDNNGISARLDQSYPQGPFNMRTDSYYDISKVEYILDDELLYSYDMDHCGEGALIYRNRFGGWDSFLLEGNISKTDNYSKLNYRTKNILHQGEKKTDSVNIDCAYETYTGWLSDEESERLVYHLASSPKVYFQDLNHPDEEIIPVRLTITNTEYKRFRNGKRLVNYTITFEKSYTEKVKD